jgi:hypothetical protein
MILVVECPTQIIELTSLSYIIYSTSAKSSTQTNKKIKLGFKKKGTKETEEDPGLAHRTVRCANEQCPVTRAIRLQTPQLRVLQSRSAIIHRNVRCATGLSGAPAKQRLQRNGRLQRTPAKVLQYADSSLRVRAAARRRTGQ